MAVAVLLAWAVVVSGIDWGLPSAARKDAVFGIHTPWTAAELKAYERPAAEPAAADVDGTPRAVDGEGVWLTDSNESRAEIIRRYLLFSNQPDEMITFMALQRMRPAERDFDPRLYQYGGLWVYPVGALLRVAGAAGLVELRSDRAFYYDRPAAFGRFYVVARLYAAAWLGVLMAAVAMAVRRVGGSDVAAVAAAVIAALMPAAFAMAHEAKPHLPGAALMMLACLAAAGWARHGRLRDAVLAGLLCGCAAAMVLTAAVVGIVLPVMMVVGRGPWGRRLAHGVVGVVVAAAAYGVCNPYVVLHSIKGGEALRQNFANTGTMYRPALTGESVRSACAHAAAALSPALMVALGVATVAWVVRPKRPSAMAALLLVPATCTAIQFTLFATGKPGEYGRFALFPAAVAVVAVGWLLSRLREPLLVAAAGAGVAIVVAWTATAPYLRAFANDAHGNGTRETVARWLRDEAPRGVNEIEIHAEPAPYAVPPIDFFRWRLMLTRPGSTPRGDLVLRAVDAPPTAPPPAGYRRVVFDGGHAPAPIAWADKPFELLVRE